MQRGRSNNPSARSAPAASISRRYIDLPGTSDCHDPLRLLYCIPPPSHSPSCGNSYIARRRTHQRLSTWTYRTQETRIDWQTTNSQGVILHLTSPPTPDNSLQANNQSLGFVLRRDIRRTYSPAFQLLERNTLHPARTTTATATATITIRTRLSILRPILKHHDLSLNNAHVHRESLHSSLSPYPPLSKKPPFSQNVQQTHHHLRVRPR
ncbi:uncharacterized protein LY79DRAFT_94605 [Colletotrichum navitas]|uniref:Uncharacterized protein n=1 Tax=Colletotrichum navitas TaxID=681940 RepID=A0AAD8V8W3_9PEZI|nr:uncharacterized protein LY79DRAFT_94605 [Colletotrichum navitas]KAK1595850.1 hypothetical protein LY79DRAFT_94605 [Colletotrichum navitas]